MNAETEEKLQGDDESSVRADSVEESASESKRYENEFLEQVVASMTLIWKRLATREEMQ